MNARHLLATVAALVFAGCLQPIEEAPSDGGTNANTDGGYQPVTDGGADAGVDAGTETGTDGGSDAGVDGGNGLAPLTWGKMTIPASSGVHAVAGIGRHHAYSVGTNGQIQRLDQSGWSKITQSPSNLDLRSVYVAPNGAVFAGGNGQLVSCTSDCTQAQSYNWKTAKDVEGVCGVDENTVYAVGTGSSISNPNLGALWQFDATTGEWALLDQASDAYRFTSCWVSPSGAVFISAQSKILRYDGGVMTSETINFPSQWTTTDIAYQQFESVWGSGSLVLAAGYRRGIIQRNASGTWDYVQQPTGVNNYEALAGTSPFDVFVGGRESGDNKFLRRFNGETWTTPTNLPTLHILGLAALDERTYLAAGYSDGVTGVVWIGTRP